LTVKVQIQIESGHERNTLAYVKLVFVLAQMLHVTGLILGMENTNVIILPQVEGIGKQL
jgi:hypothetical protein